VLGKEKGRKMRFQPQEEMYLSVGQEDRESESVYDHPGPGKSRSCQHCH
jgi:hypothetical protein